MATELSRRSVLGRLALGLGVVACGTGRAQPAADAAFVAIETEARSGLSRALFLSATGALTGTVPLDFRAHGMAEHGDTLVVFPRRPGNRFSVVTRGTLDIGAVVTAPPTRHFYGHGAFTRDGRHLLVTENDLDSLQGFLGVYTMEKQVRRVGQIALPRPGPHEITRAPGSDRFHVALGGLETHPDYGRTALNLSGFRSEILQFDFDSGALDPLGLWTGSEGISLRHLAVDGAGRLFVGGQVADASRARPEAVLWMVSGNRVTRLDAGADLGGYVSSVAAHGETVRVASKESGVILDLVADRVVARRRIEGAGAVALSERGGIAAGVRLLTLNGQSQDAAAGCEFDNHALAIRGGL